MLAYYCPDCGREVTKRGRRCMSCAAKARWTRRMIHRPFQEFEGVRYYQLPDGYWKCSHALPGHEWLIHREMWRVLRGEIPGGAQVHHVNGDASDNRLDNLVALSPKKHAEQHPERASKVRRANLERWRTAPRRSLVCAQCAAPFEHSAWNARYCSAKCRIRHWNSREIGHGKSKS
jgi:hypothetical protein